MSPTEFWATQANTCNLVRKYQKYERLHKNTTSTYNMFRWQLLLLQFSLQAKILLFIEADEANGNDPLATFMCQNRW